MTETTSRTQLDGRAAAAATTRQGDLGEGPDPLGNLLDRRTVLAAGTSVLGLGLLAACSPGDGGSPGGDGGAATPGGALVALADVPVGGAVAATTAASDKVVVAQPEAGTVVAFSAICTHQGCTVAPDGAELHCPCHGSVFEAFTGAVVNWPASEPLPSVAVRIEGDGVVEA